MTSNTKRQTAWRSPADATEQNCWLSSISRLLPGFGSEEQLCRARIISNHFGFGQELFVNGADVTCRGAGKAKNFALIAVPADLVQPLSGKSC
jgi:hypothetical protein